MQCTRCAKTLPEGVSFCLACGFPVNTGGQTPIGGAPRPDGASLGVPFVQSQVNGMGQGPEPAKSGFVFQEFGGTPTRSATAPGLTPPGSLPGYPAGLTPPSGLPGYPGTAPGFAPNTMPGYPGATPYPFSPSGQGMYPPIMPMVAPPKPKRRGRSVGCIVLYVFLAIALLFIGLGTALYQIGSHANANYSATKTTAMQLYQQVTSQPATIQDLLAGPVATNWLIYQEAHYGCELDNTALRVSVDDKDLFSYCKDVNNFSSDIAFQAQMNISGDGGGLVFRVTPSADGTTDGFYLFEINLHGTYAIYLHQINAMKQISLLAEGITQAMDTQSGQTNTVTVIAKGTLFDLYINQQFVVQFQNGTLNGTMVGVVASDATQATNVLYTGMKLWDLDK